MKYSAAPPANTSTKHSWGGNSGIRRSAKRRLPPIHGIIGVLITDPCLGNLIRLGFAPLRRDEALVGALDWIECFGVEPGVSAPDLRLVSCAGTTSLLLAAQTL